jgi:hypothetical protein
LKIEQREADRLRRLDKVIAEDKQYNFPAPGEGIRIPLISVNGQERFILDIHRGKRRMFKCTYQERYGVVAVLVRLDMNPSRHVNPYVLFPPDGFEQYNGMQFDDAHLHLYVEGWGDKWAIPASNEGFFDPTNISELSDNFTRFLTYCNVSGLLEMVEVLV